MLVLDCRGQRCPLPIIELARRITEVANGAVVRVIADDPAAAFDIPAWCRLKGHEFMGKAKADSMTEPAFDVRRLR